MLPWLIIPLVATALVAVGMIAMTRLYRTPRVAHRRNPGSLGIGFEEIRFATAGGKQLHGWWVPCVTPESSGSLILVHGWGRNVERMLPFIRGLHAAGFDLLAFDARCHGSSDVDGTANMLKFSADIRAALDEARRRGADPARLGVLGLSVGGAAAIHAAAHDNRIRAVITVGAFAHPGDLMRREVRSRSVPGLLVPLILKYVEYSIGARLDEIAPERQIRNIVAPLLLVHGEVDTVIPRDDAHRLAEAAGTNAELLLLAGRGHSDCSRDAVFWERATEFLDRALGS